MQREKVRKRRQEVTVEKEKRKYFHLIKRDVLKHRKEVYRQEAEERIRQARRLTKWLVYICLLEQMRHMHKIVI